MKGITPIIAIIVLLLITVALAGVAWSYLQGYMGGLTSKSLEVRDYFCSSTNSPILVVANIGTTALGTGEIIVMDAGTGTSSVGTWTAINGSAVIPSIPIGGVAKWTQTAACPSGTTCAYRVTAGAGGRTQSVSVVC